MYSVLHFGHMAADGVRMDAYARAIERAVKPGSIVLDIGAGTGIFSLLAARAGASRVHAVDPNPAIWVLADLAKENGYADRITIHHTTSYELELDPKADVVVSDLRGTLPVFEQHIDVLRDARTRLLAPGGTLIPARDELCVALFENDELAASLAKGTSAFEQSGFASRAIRSSIFNTTLTDRGKLRASDLLTSSAPWATMTYGLSGKPLEGSVDLAPRRRGTAHGLAVWFVATIYENLGFTTQPGMATAYARLVLPLLEPVRIDHDDAVNVVIRVDDQGDRWAWDTTVTTKGQPKAQFRQSTFFGMPTSPEALLRASSHHKPERSKLGERAMEALTLMDGTRTVAEIAGAIPEPQRAPHTPAATLVEEVRNLAARYGR